jgi:hypothetical protein
MPGPTPTFNPNALENLFKPVPEVYKPAITSGALNFQLPVSGHGNIDFPYSNSKNKASSDPMVDGLRNLFSSGPSEKFMNSTIKYNADEINAARYVTSPDYLKLGISLTGSNEENYGQNQSWSEVLSNGFSGMGKLAANGFTDGWKQWGRTFDALSHWDWNRLHGDAQSMLELDNNLKDIMNSNPIYATKEGTDTFWNRQMFGNFLQQSGFAVGALAQIASEQILTKAIESVLTASVAGAPEALLLETATDVKSAGTLSRIGKFFNKSKEFFNTSKAVTSLKKLGDIWKNDAIVKKFATSIGQRLPGVDVAMDISKTFKTGVDAGLSGTQLAGDIAKVGLGGLKRTMSEANFAFTEARMEAAGTFGDLYNQMQDDHFKRTGAFAQDADLQNMQDIAMKAADKNFNFNSAVLAVSNRIMFDNVFKNSKVTSKILSKYGEDLGEKGFKVLGKINGKTTSQYYTGNIFSNYKTIAADFGTRKARTVLAKSIMKPALKFEFTEGIQELIQEGSAEYYKDYYLNSYKATYNPNIEVSSQKSLDKAISSQMTMQGLKTFASGALTGMLLHGPTVLIGKAGAKLSEGVKDTYKTSGFTKEEKEKYFEDKKASKEELKNYYNEFNAIAKDPSKFFSESIKNFNVQKEGSSALDEAAKLGDKFSYENIRTDMLHSMVSQAVRNETHEALADTLREYGKNMSKEEFEQAFVGLDYNSENKKSAADYTEKVAKSVESYAKIYNKLQDKYGSRVNPNRYAEGSKEFNKELSKKQVLNNMIDVLAGNEFKSIDAAERSLSLYTKASSHKTLGSSLASAYNILGSEGNIKKEMSVLNLEIEAKNEQLKSEDISKDDKNKLKNEIELKEKQKKSLQEWLDNKDELIDERKVTKSYSAFKNYLELKNKEFGKDSVVNVNELEDLFVEFNDYIKLNKKSQKHVDAINMLSNPRYFDQVYTKMVVGSQLAYQQLLQEAANEEIKAGLSEPNKHFIMESNGSYGIFTPGGEVLTVVDTLEEAREIKEKLDSAIFSEDDLDEFVKNNEVPESEASDTEKKSEEKPAESKEKKPVKILINGKVAIIISQELNKKDGKDITKVSYAFENDVEKEIYQFLIIDGKAVDAETGEQITISAVETKEKLGNKSIDEQIAELEDKIKNLPDNGMVATKDGMGVSEELKDLRNQIKALKESKEKTSTETANTQSDIEAKKADIERRRQEELDITPVASYGVMASSYLFQDGKGAILSTDYFLQALTSIFPYAGKQINNIRNNYLTKLGNIKDDIGTDNYNSAIQEIKNEINNIYKSEKAIEIFENILENSTGFISRIGNEVSSKVDKLNNEQEKQINAKYDAELAALEKETTTTPGAKPVTSELTKEEVMSDFLNQINKAIVQFGNPKLLTEYETVSIDKTLKNQIVVNHYKYNNDKKFDDKINEVILNLPEDLKNLLFGYNINVTGRNLYIELRNKDYIDTKVAEKYGLPTKNGEKLTIDLNQPITSTESETEDTDVIDDIDQIFNDKKDVLDKDSIEADKIFQEGIRQTEPALSLGNTTHFVKVVEIKPGKEMFERGEVNKTYEFETATPTFMPGKSVTFKVDEFDGTNYDNANIGIYAIIKGKETRIGAVHTPQWIAEQKGPNKAYSHIVIPENEKNDKLPKTLEKELKVNRKLRKVILDNHKNNSNFVLNGTVNDKSIGIIVTMDRQGTLAERLNPEIGKGGLENRHGMFGIIRGGFIETAKGYKIDANKMVSVKSFNSDNISQYEGYSIMLIPTPTGQFFPTFIKLPNVAREQSEFILKAWKAFTNKETNFDLIKEVYEAVGEEYKEGKNISLKVLKDYIDHYITNLNSKSLSQLGNGVDAPDNTSRLDIYDDGNIKLQGKKDGKWIDITIRKEDDIPSNILDYMDNLITTIRFNNAKDKSLLGINSTNKVSIFGVKDNKFYSKKMTYNQYIMEGAKTYLEKGIESKNENNDWVYFANPVIKFEYTEPINNSLEKMLNNEKPEVNLTDVTEVSKEDKAAAFLAALKANSLKNKQIDEQKNKCSTK